MFKKSSFITKIKRLNHSWAPPIGYDTGIKIFNCVTRDKQPLIVKNKNIVTWYTCGPTVYDSSHLGHASCYVKLDIIQRILKSHFNLNLVTVMNITDVDDKLIARSKGLKRTVQELAKKYEKEFWVDMESLQIDKPNCILRVTENMEIIKDFIRNLLEGGKAYHAEDKSVYFDVNVSDHYGKLQNINEDSVEGNAQSSKRNIRDFALWKASKPGEIFWESPWGPGRPGWHIECSALASFIFGSNIDIHAGGIDLRFPHHENEEAQSCAYHSTNQWVNYWIHTGHLHLKSSVKMSKSLKNTVPINTMLQNNQSEVFRMACIMSHYRSPMEFTSEFMDTATNLLKNYKNFLNNCDNFTSGLLKARLDDAILTELLIKSANAIHNAFCDDFNTPVVVNILNEIVLSVNGMLHSGAAQQDIPKQSAPLLALGCLIKQTLKVMGIVDKSSLSHSGENFVEVVNILNNFRQDVRRLAIENKDKDVLQICDEVRDNLNKCGIVVKDHGKVSSWST